MSALGREMAQRCNDAKGVCPVEGSSHHLDVGDRTNNEVGDRP